MISVRCRLLAGGAVAALLLAGCGDDGGDAAYRARRAAERAAELRVGAPVDEAPATPAGEQPAAEQPTTEPPADPLSTTAATTITITTITTTITITTTAPEPEVEPTGVVVPVIALDNSFRPDTIEISVGDEVLWENRGLNEHDVLYVEGDDWGVEVEEFQPGDAYAHVFTEPGEYRYYCSIHGSTDVGMVGTVVVTG